MGSKIAILAAIAALSGAGGSACAMTSDASPLSNCRAAGKDGLPPESGGVKALCTEIEQAVARQAPRAKADVELRLLTPSRLSAVVTTADGRRLPEQHYAIMDRKIDRSSFTEFAEALARQLAESLEKDGRR